ncbi:SDR family oxidoreductase [Nocardioides carbamazepini]|uniref:SDR family NAD(P)-dependent oxidoreductase n=1 Tax=Nocardioides carbamazepini TaxID=2854259 RepID=UPI002149E6FE|nr:SDR family oxidoreductase [Nocardioides carbamazepini]MCR1783670.1 SDR family oxidoreductase [Nocardioides carbamazepini]
MAVVVTGGTSGLGLAVARRLATPGGEVFLTYSRDSSAAADARTQLGSTGATVHLVRADLAERGGARAVADAVRARVDAVSHLVHAAAAGAPGALLEHDGADLDRAVRLNGTSVAHVVRELSSLLLPGASVVFVTSAGARCALDGYGLLGAPKALAEHLVRHLARELAPRGVRVNCVSPGPIDTKARREMFPDTWESRLADQVAATPAARGVTAEEVAGVIAALAGPDFAMVQGQVLTVDGGLTL